jgi:hypothetical protein
MNPWADHSKKPWYVRGFIGLVKLFDFREDDSFRRTCFYLALFFAIAYFFLTVLTPEPY